MTERWKLNVPRSAAMLAVVAGLWLGPNAAAASDDAAGRARPAGGVVELPPFVVDELAPWRCMKMEGREYISRCPDAVTLKFAQREQRVHELLGLILPLRFQFVSAVPQGAILTLADKTPINTRELVQREAADAAGRQHDISDATVRFMPNVVIPDLDALFAFIILDPKNVDLSRIVYTRSQVRLLAERHAPPLPEWYKKGVYALMSHVDFGADELKIAVFDGLAAGEDTGLRGDADYPRHVMAMQDFFATASEAQAELFLRWALAGGAARTAGFWQLVEAAMHGPVSETMVENCLGCDWATLRDRLSDYLPVAVLAPMVLKLPGSASAERPAIHDATPAEVGRLVGDWHRLAARSVRNRAPEFSAMYERQARATLERALKEAPTDPELNAIAGLFEVDAGNDAPAQPLLERAAAARVVRPRVYYELARLRYLHAVGKRDSEVRLTTDQMNSILAPLSLGGDPMPQLPDAHALMCQVCDHSAERLASETLAKIEQAVAMFPRHLQLLYYAARVEAANASLTTAAEWAKRGWDLSESVADLTRFTQLRDAIAARMHEQKVRPGGQAPAGEGEGPGVKSAKAEPRSAP